MASNLIVFILTTDLELFYYSLTCSCISTLYNFMEIIDNFEARTERVNFGLLQLNSDLTWPNLTL